MDLCAIRIIFILSIVTELFPTLFFEYISLFHELFDIHKCAVSGNTQRLVPKAIKGIKIDLGCKDAKALLAS